MSVISNNILAGASGQAGGAAAGYQIERSLRFNSGDSAYLNRTPSSAGNRKTWTWSGWVKRGSLGVSNVIFESRTGTSDTTIMQLSFNPNDQLQVVNYNYFPLKSSSVYRDTSAWYHILWVLDTTQSTASDKMKLYVNGVEITDYGTDNRSSLGTSDQAINQTAGHYFGALGGTQNYFSGYLADVHFIDGQALAPTDFGEFDANGVWQPKAYAGSYGTNGFKLNFSDNSSAAALGTDSSGNSNTWTVNNLTAVVGSAPTKTLTRLRFKTDWNWMFVSQIKINGTSLTTGTLDNTGSVWTDPDKWKNGSVGSGNETYSQSARGDWFDVTLASSIANFNDLEIYVYLDSSAGTTTNIFEIELFFSDGTSYTKTYATNSDAPNQAGAGFNTRQWQDFANLSTPGSELDSLFDSPTNGTQTDTGLGGEVSGNYATWNPLSSSGVTLSNGNLDATNSNSATKIASSTIVPTAKCYWEVTVETPRTGAIGGVHGVNAQGGRPDQSGGAGIYLAGSGSGGGTYVNGTQTAADYSASAGDIIGFAFDPSTRSLIITRNGSSVGTLTAPDTDNLQPVSALNQSVDINVNFGQRAFAFAQSGFKALNTANLPDPTIADGSDYMDVVTYTATGGTAQSITGLEFNPDLVWLKAKVAGAHNIFDSVRGATKGLRSNDTAAEYTDSETLTSFDSNGFSLGPDSNGYQVNFSNNPMVGWTWDAGHPATATTGAVSFDGSGDYLELANSTDFDQEGDFTQECFYYQNGNGQGSVDIIFLKNVTNYGYIGIDFGGTNQVKFQQHNIGNLITGPALASKRWYHLAATRSGSTVRLFVDGVLVGSTTYSTDTTGTAVSRIGGVPSAHSLNGFIPTAELTNVTNTKLLCCQSTTSATAAAVTPGTITANGDVSATTFNPLDAFSVNGTGYATTSAAGITEGTIPLTGASVNRSAGFSIVSYTGTGAAGTVGHGLNAAPKIVIFKNRDAATNWRVYTNMVDGSMDSLFLNTTAAKTDSSLSAFTSSVFYCGTNPDHNGNNQAMVAYCFAAPVEGYSSMGSYQGNGSADGPFVYTGHRSRWLMVKRTDTSGYPWVIVDALRDGYNVTYKWLEPNSFSEEQSVQPVADVDFLSNGFKMRGAGNTTNQLAGTYLYVCFSENPFKYTRAR
jgi:hypothetical protein